MVLGSRHGLAIAAADALDHLGEPSRRRPADLASLKTIAGAVRRDGQPLVVSVRRRTVAKVLSRGWVGRTCFQQRQRR